MPQANKASETSVTVTGESFVQKDRYIVTTSEGAVTGDSSNIAMTVTYMLKTYPASDSSNIAMSVTYSLQTPYAATDSSNIAMTVTYGTAAVPVSSSNTWTTESKATSAWTTEAKS